MRDIPRRSVDDRLPEVTRIARVLQIIWRISNAPRSWTRARLAEHFEVSERTITGDIDMIRHSLKYEIGNDRGRGYYFERVPQLPEVSYSLPEALAIILAAEAGRHVAGIPQADLAGAIARLESVFPPGLSAMLRRFNEDSGHGGRTHREQMMRTCAEAVMTNRPLMITYRVASRGGDVTERRVDPYAIVPYGRAWHMVGYCHLRDDLRVFKLDRIMEADILPGTFKPPRESQVEEYLDDGWGLMRGLDAPVERVSLLFSPTAARWIADEHWHPSQVMTWDSDGALRFEVVIQVTPEFQRWVFGYGSEVEVIAPQSLRHWMCAEAERVTARYAAARP